MSLPFVYVILAFTLMANNAVKCSPHWNFNADDDDDNINNITESESLKEVNLVPRTIKRNENDEQKSSSCPCHWIYLDGRCYYISKKTAASWLDARAYCRARAGDLAVPTGKINNNHLYSAMKERNVERAWIGLYRVAEGLGHKFYTVKGVEASYTNWHEIEPNDFGGKEDCVELLYKTGYYDSKIQDIGGKWNDISIKKPNHFICQLSFQS